MMAEDIERLAELEALKDAGEELDEDDREALRELRAEARAEKRQEKALAKFIKAKIVFKVAGQNLFFLDRATAGKWGQVEEIDPKTLGPVIFGTFQGYMIDDNFGEGEAYAVEEEEDDAPSE
jgi:hypothetical protein